ncbi:GNAT family N-acetyltransferase [Psychrobacillus sp. NPDC058041]|uniref:GNAT family N-acetyltransferase n=1 Tax=Psychrobacillus sp. NPDC058041 TaxID=3346310 RepID=UPI0036DE532B
MMIRPYCSTDEVGWVRCRTLAFLDTAYYENVLNKKEKYENPAIELVAELGGLIVGLIDVEYEVTERTVCSRGTGLGGMIWHIAVHPDYRRQGIGEALLKEAEKLAILLGLNRLEAWTRDDEWVNNWYEKNQFLKVDSYYHVFMEGSELNGVIEANISKMYPATVFAHYIGQEIDMLKTKFKRIHECVCYEKHFYGV